MGSHLYSSFLWKHGIDKELGSDKIALYMLYLKALIQNLEERVVSTGN